MGAGMALRHLGEALALLARTVKSLLLVVRLWAFWE